MRKDCFYYINYQLKMPYTSVNYFTCSPLWLFRYDSLKGSNTNNSLIKQKLVDELNHGALNLSRVQCLKQWVSYLNINLKRSRTVRLPQRKSPQNVSLLKYCCFSSLIGCGVTTTNVKVYVNKYWVCITNLSQ